MQFEIRIRKENETPEQARVIVIDEGMAEQVWVIGDKEVTIKLEIKMI